MRLIFPGGDDVWFFLVAPAEANPNAPVSVNWATNAGQRSKLANTLRIVADKLEEV